MPSAVDTEKFSPSPHNVEHCSSESTEDRDIAMAIVGEHRQEIDPATEARVVRKIDCFLVPAMVCGYGLVYYDKVSTLYPLSSHMNIHLLGDLGFSSPFRNDNRPSTLPSSSLDHSTNNQYLTSKLGNLNVLFWNASWPVSYDFCTAKIQHGPNSWYHCLFLGCDLYAHRSCHFLARTLCSTILSRLRRKHHTYELYVHR
jgi:hypothetical protein